MSEQVHTTGPMYRPSSHTDQGIDAGTKRILYFMGAGGLAILAAIGIYSVAGHSGSGVVPTIQADQGPMRVKPVDPGGMAVAPEMKQVNSASSQLAPATEEPNPRALMAITTPPRPPASVPALTQPHPRNLTVQLSAAKSEAQALNDWNQLAKRLPDLFAQHHALFQKTNEPGAAPWRLRTGGFADPAQAKAFCDKVKARGGQCSIVES